MTIKYSEDINNKVVLKDDILRLLTLVAENIRPKKKNDIYGSEYFAVSLRAKDGLSYQFDEPNFEEVEGVLRSKRITKIDITYRERDSDSTLICVLDTSKYGFNYYQVESKNKTWFNARKSQMQDFFKDVQDQSNFYLKYRSLISFLASIYLGYIILLVIFQVVSLIYNISHVEIKQIDYNSTSYKLTSTFIYPLTICLSYLIGSIPIDIIRRRIDELWPRIEFNFGPAHLNTLNKNREVWKYVITVIVLPLIVGIATTIFN